jgi:hypothetical protein
MLRQRPHTHLPHYVMHDLMPNASLTAPLVPAPPCHKDGIAACSLLQHMPNAHPPAPITSCTSSQASPTVHLSYRIGSGCLSADATRAQPTCSHHVKHIMGQVPVQLHSWFLHPIAHSCSFSAPHMSNGPTCSHHVMHILPQLLTSSVLSAGV